MADNTSYPTLLENPKNNYHMDLIEYSDENVPAWAKSHESLAGTVSSKEKNYSNRIRGFGFICSNCKQKGWKRMQKKIRENEESQFLSWGSMMARAFPVRCKKCKSASSKYTRANAVFVRLDELRANAEVDCLRFTTFTHKKWNRWVPHGCDLLENQNILKSQSLKQARNWRHRNAWWQTREAVGQYWPECTIKGEGKIIDGKLHLGYRLHFHIHCILVSKYLDNKVIEEPVHMDSKFFREWGGIVDVRSVENYNVPYNHKGETRYGCGRKACLRYLTKYITKAKGWKSGKIGIW